jgi:hypothetical protein
MIYFGFKLVDGASQIAQELIAYQKNGDFCVVNLNLNFMSYLSAHGPQF